MESKFWTKDSGYSGVQSHPSHSESSESDDYQADNRNNKKNVPSMWANIDDASSDGDDRRFVRSGRDKLYDQLRPIIKAMQNHKNIDDYGELLSSFESLMKIVKKNKTVIMKDGIPPFFVRAIAELESYISNKFYDKENLKKQSKTKSVSFNILRSKARKNLEEYSELIKEYHQDPSKFIDKDVFNSSSSSAGESDESENSNDNDDFEDSNDSDGSSSAGKDSFDDPDRYSENKNAKDKKKDMDSDSEDWGNSYDSDYNAPTADDDRQNILKIWGKKETVTEKKKNKRVKKKVAKPASTKNANDIVVVAPVGRSKILPVILPGEKIDAELLSKKLKEITAQRGRKNFDRLEQIRQLEELYQAAKTISRQSELEILGPLISIYFDNNMGAFVAMSDSMWMKCYDYITDSFNILNNSKDCYFLFLIPEDENSDDALDKDQDRYHLNPLTVTTNRYLSSIRNAHSRENTQGDTISKEGKARLETHLMLMRYVERLDDELLKAFQLTEIDSEEYKLRLYHSIDMLALLWKAYLYFKKVCQVECLTSVKLRILEHIYYKTDSVMGVMWNLIAKKLDPSDAEMFNDSNFLSSNIIRKFFNELLDDSVDKKDEVRPILYLAYNESLHGNYYEAKYLLQTANIHEFASQCNISTQVAYNRNLVQLGLAAFRLGLISESYSYLSEVCSMGRYKELLAQGLSNVPRGADKNLEQEKIAKRRLLPYHMHIAGDVVEAVHNICAMLLEVPNIAANPFDYLKKSIARNFRRFLEMYERQPFTGPPENPRELIMAATRALQKSNWKLCVHFIMSLKIWKAIPDSENVQKILTDRIKEEALRTHILSYSSIYDSLSVTQLSLMFDLPADTVHSIISKMVIKKLLSGSWDGASECILINRVEKTPYQVLALQLTDKIAQAVDQNETLLSYRNPKFVMSQNYQRDDRNKRYDERWTNFDKKNSTNYNSLNSDLHSAEKVTTFGSRLNTVNQLDRQGGINRFLVLRSTSTAQQTNTRRK